MQHLADLIGVHRHMPAQAVFKQRHPLIQTVGLHPHDMRYLQGAGLSTAIPNQHVAGVDGQRHVLAGPPPLRRGVQVLSSDRKMVATVGGHNVDAKVVSMPHGLERHRGIEITQHTTAQHLGHLS